jgi:hypothetical protein
MCGPASLGERRIIGGLPPGRLEHLVVRDEAAMATAVGSIDVIDAEFTTHE